MVVYVIDGMFKTAYPRVDLSEEMLRSPLVQAILHRFGPERLVGQSDGARPGRLLLNTVKESGLSVRVYSSKVSKKRDGFSIMSITSGQPQCEFPSLAELGKRLPDRGLQVAQYAQSVARLGAADILSQPVGTRVRLLTSIVEKNFDELADVMEGLM